MSEYLDIALPVLRQDHRMLLLPDPAHFNKKVAGSLNICLLGQDHQMLFLPDPAHINNKITGCLTIWLLVLPDPGHLNNKIDCGMSAEYPDSGPFGSSNPKNIAGYLRICEIYTNYRSLTIS